MSEFKIFEYSENDFIFILFLMWFLTYFFGQMYAYGKMLDLPIEIKVYSTLGDILRIFAIYNFIPLLLGLIAISKWLNLSNRYSPFLKMLIRKALWLFVVISLAQIVIYGVESHFCFLGYLTLNLSILAYSFIALYLIHLFQKQTFLNEILAISLGILVISELWELPFNLYYADSHPFMLLVVICQRYVPIFFWFYAFRKVYQNFLKKWFLIIPLSFLIILLTIGSILINPMIGPVDTYLRFALYLAYASLLIFFPFHYFFKSKDVK